MMVPHDLDQRAQQALPQLGARLQAVLRHLLAHRDDIALVSMRSLAMKAGVAPPTMLRLARALGYPDWNALRSEVQDGLRARPLTDRARSLTAREDGDEIIAELAAADEDNLRHSWAGITPGQMQAAVNDLRQARRVFFLGQRSCFPAAFAMHYAYRAIRDNGVLVADDGGGIFSPLLHLDAGDALIVVGFDPYSSETVTLTHDAAARGACIIAITDGPLSPLALAGRHVFMAMNDSPALFPSTIAAQSIGQALIALMIAGEGEAAVGRMQQNEDRLHALGAFWKGTA